MLNNLNFSSKTLKIMTAILTLTGIIFILLSDYIGRIAIRIVMFLIILFTVVNFKMTYKYLSGKEKTTHLLSLAGAIAGIYKPELTMLILGAFLLYISIPPYIKIIKDKDYSNILPLILSGTGILFAVLCILNSRTALKTIVIIIGIIFTILGCLSLYNLISNTNNKNDDNNISNFEDNSLS